MDTRITTGELEILWEVGPITKSLSGKVVSWQFDLQMKGRPPYLSLAFADQTTARKQRTSLQKIIDECSLIVPHIVG
jgi:hypothetical protein